MKIVFSFIVFSIVLLACSTTKKSTVSVNATNDKADNFIINLMRQNSPLFDSVLGDIDQNRLQIIYTQIDRNENGKPEFNDHYFNISDSSYFYPASTVKLPIAILALQKLNELKIAGLDKNTTMISEADYSGQSEVYNDPSTPDGRPTIEHYIKKILLVSDNDAFNRLYEFLGQGYINNTLHSMGYKEVQIVHRLDISLTEDENRHTNPVRFFDTSGKLVYQKPMETSKLIYAIRNTKMGVGFYRDGEIVNEPFDFSKKNRLSLTTLHSIVRSVMFPEAVPKKQRFNLTKDDYEFLHRYMSMTPLESKFPFYDTANYWDSYVKFLLYGSEKIR
jgi:hypothetical protein